MSDLETIREILTRAEIVFSEPRDDLTVLMVEANTGPNNGGYAEFVAVLSFTSDGALSKWDNWE